MTGAPTGGTVRNVELTHRDAINALSERELVRLKRRSDTAGLLHLGLHLSLLGLTGWVILASPFALLVAVALVVHGILLVFLFAPLHECIHETAFRSHWLNQVVATIAGFILLLPPRYFRYFHLAHHRHTQDAEKDPELATPKPADWPTYLWRLTGIDYWRGQFGALVSCAFGRRLPAFIPANGRARVAAEARGYVAAYLVVAAVGLMAGLSWLVWLWILPVLVGQPFLRAYLLAEHTGCPFVPDMLANSRTVFAGPLIQRLAWNMPNHTAHHAMPSVPFHRLPELTAILKSNLKTTSPSYLETHKDITRNF